jgi:hypothetical protein
MTQGKRVALSAAQRSELWSRWKAGQSLRVIGRALDRPHTSIHCLLSHHGGIVPPVRRRSLLVLTAVEREDISRGLASGSSTMLAREGQLFGWLPSRPSQSSVPAGLTLTSEFGFCFQCQAGSSSVLHRPVETTGLNITYHY